MQIGVDKDVIITTDTVEYVDHVMGDIGMIPLSKEYRVRSFSLNMKDGHEIGLDCKVSATV